MKKSNIILKKEKLSYSAWFQGNEKIGKYLFNHHRHIEIYNGDDKKVYRATVVYLEKDIQKLIKKILKGEFNDKSSDSGKTKRTRNTKK